MTYTKTCEFCGQVVTVDAGVEPWEVCRCKEAVEQQRQRDAVTRAEEGIDRLFGEGAEEIGFHPLDEGALALLKKLAEAIIRGKARTITVQLPGGGTAMLKEDGYDVRIARKESKKATA